jgi:hypothetical protein
MTFNVKRPAPVTLAEALTLAGFDPHAILAARLLVIDLSMNCRRDISLKAIMFLPAQRRDRKTLRHNPDQRRGPAITPGRN